MSSDTVLVLEHELNWYAYHIALLRYFIAAGVALTVLDHAITFGDEVDLVWRAPRSATKYFFLLSRYMVPVGMFITFFLWSGLVRIPFSDSVYVFAQSTPQTAFELTYSCRANIAILMYIWIISIACMDFLMLLRLWALWDKKRAVVIITGCGFLITQIVTIAMGSYVIIGQGSLITYVPDFHICVRKSAARLIYFWGPGLVFDALMFFFTIWNALDRPRSSQTTFVQTLLQDGIPYFVVISALRITNAVTTLTADPVQVYIPLTFIWGAVATVSSRLVLNTRRLEAKASRLYELYDEADDDYDSVEDFSSNSSFALSSRSRSDSEATLHSEFLMK